MENKNFNYADAFNSSNQLGYQSMMHDKAIEVQGRKTYIFKLDKKKTDKSEIYNEAINARVYLPHFEQRALYNLNTWNNFVGTNNFVENEETLEFEYNFARLVCNIRDLKDKISGSMLIKNNSDEILRIIIEDGKMIIRTSMGVVLVDKELEKYKNIKMLMDEIESECSLVKLSYEGDSEEAKNLESINTKLLPNRTMPVELTSRVYSNCIEVITEGDIILTDKYKAYQVNNAYPSNGMINEYIGWKCNCNTIDLAKANLPDDYRKIINRNEYSLPKTRKE